jgi:Undecaprenyl-phosphate galactose phosphotransferase WbaP
MSTAIIRANIIAVPRTSCRPGMSTLVYLLADVIALVLAWSIAVVGRRAFGGDFHFAWYLRLWPMITVCLVAFGVRSLYPAQGISPVEEFRRLTVATAVVYASLIVFTFLEHSADAYSRLVFVIAWLLSAALLPLGRAIVRKVAGSQPWWGTPTVLLGNGSTATAVLRSLRTNPGLGIRVEAAFGNDPDCRSLDGVPVLGGLEEAPEVALRAGISTAIVALPDLTGCSLYEVVNKFGKYFPDLLIVPDVCGPGSLCMEARSLGHLITLGVRQNLLLRGPRICKRTLDIALALAGGVFLLPLLLAVAIAIKLSSQGPVFYSQRRIGKGQKPFDAWKFRTMVQHADKILAEHLARDAALRKEWERDHKLRNDPRVTKLGKVLRTLSIDELPQLWNVLRGEMSLIGPRPIVWAEVSRYADRFEVYTRVLPGITGLWQVSGRNDTDYQQRVELDAYYVHNWSPWLDLYVLARTFKAVLNRRGAY